MAHQNLGVNVIVGMRQQAAYRTALVANTLVPILSENIIENFNRHLDESLDGTAGYEIDDDGMKMVEGSMECLLRYDEENTEFVGTDLPLAIAMGSNTYHAGSTANQLIFASDLDEYATIAMYKGNITGSNNLWEFIGAMCKSFRIEGDKASEHVKVTFDWSSYNNKRSSCVNTATDLTTLPDDIASIVKMTDLTFRIASDFSDVLASGDNITISSFSLAVDNKLVTDDGGSIDATHTDATLILQPKRAGKRDVMFEFVVPRYEADTFHAAKVAGTPLQASLIFTNGSDTFTLLIPYLKVETCESPAGGSEVIPVNVTMRALRGAAYNGGVGNTVMLFADAATVVADELGIELVNDRSAAILT